MSGSAADLIRHIVDRFHAPLRSDLAAIAALLEREDGGEPDPLRLTFETLREDLLAHLEKEERVLFPHVVDMEDAVAGRRAAEGGLMGVTQGVVSVMMREHGTARLSLLSLRRLAAELPQAGDLHARLAALDDALIRHMALEDDVLFPKALELERRLRAAR